MVKNLNTNTGSERNGYSVTGLGRSPGGGNGNSLWYSCLENSMDREAWPTTVHGVAKSNTMPFKLFFFSQWALFSPLYPISIVNNNILCTLFLLEYS